MNETKIEWSDLELFLAVARGGGLAGGAAISGTSAPTLGRHMVKLERVLGDVLFERLARGYVLTEAGAELLTDAELVERGVLGIVQRRRNRAARLPIRISAGTWITRFLVQNISVVQSDAVRLAFQASEDIQNVGRREATIALRNLRPDDPSLAIRKTVRVAFAPYAAEQAAVCEDWIVTTAQTASANWVRAHHGAQIVLEASSPRSVLDAARLGAGQVVLPCFVGDAEGDLTRTGPVIEALSHDQWLVVHGDDRNLPAVRQTTDAIAALLRSSRSLFDGSS